MAIPNSTYTEIITTTLAYYQPELADNVLTHNPLLDKIKKKGNAAPVGGGTTILENLMYQQNSTVLWYSGLDQLNVSTSDVLTSANFDWRELNCNVVVSGLDKARNSGTKESVFNLVKSRIKVAEITMQNTIAGGLFFSNTENSGKSIGGLKFLVADAGTGIVGGIDSSSNTWWKNQFYSFSGQSVTASSTTIQAAMNTVYINTVRGKDKPDMWVGGTTYFQYYLASLQANQRFMGEKEASLGFANLTFWGGMASVFFDPNETTGTRLYALNTDYIHYRPHTDFNFVTLDDKTSVNQDATVVPLYWKGNMTVSNRARQGAVVT